MDEGWVPDRSKEHPQGKSAGLSNTAVFKWDEVEHPGEKVLAKEGIGFKKEVTLELEK